MDRFISYLIRLVMITIGFIAAAMTAGVLIAFMTKVITPSEVGQLSDTGFDAGLIILAMALASIAGYVAFFPAMLIIIFSELSQRRSWLYYAICGGVTAALTPLIITLFKDSERQSDYETFAMTVAAGMIAGIVYWLVAGRNAGNWLPQKQTSSSKA